MNAAAKINSLLFFLSAYLSLDAYIRYRYIIIICSSFDQSKGTLKWKCIIKIDKCFNTYMLRIFRNFNTYIYEICTSLHWQKKSYTVCKRRYLKYIK